mgnify:CR=1 FL=1
MVIPNKAYMNLAAMRFLKFDFPVLIMADKDQLYKTINMCVRNSPITQKSAASNSLHYSNQLLF